MKSIYEQLYFKDNRGVITSSWYSKDHEMQEVFVCSLARKASCVVLTEHLFFSFYYEIFYDIYFIFPTNFKAILCDFF